jgi:hypothetical protein
MPRKFNLEIVYITLTVIHILLLLFEHNVSETGFCLRLQVVPILLVAVRRINLLSPDNSNSSAY